MENMKHGKNTFFHPNGNIKYEGSVINKMKHGQGTEYDEHRVKIYEGQWKEDSKDGRGTEYYSETGTKKYEGDWLEDLKEGEGILYSPSGQIEYIGYFKEGQKFFKGKQYLQYNEDPDLATLIYDGRWSNDQFCGKGVFYHNDGK